MVTTNEIKEKIEEHKSQREKTLKAFEEARTMIILLDGAIQGLEDLIKEDNEDGTTEADDVPDQTSGKRAKHGQPSDRD